MEWDMVEDEPYRARLELKSSVPPSSELKESTVSNLKPLGTRACVVDATCRATHMMCDISIRPTRYTVVVGHTLTIRTPGLDAAVFFRRGSNSRVKRKGPKWLKMQRAAKVSSDMLPRRVNVHTWY